MAVRELQITEVKVCNNSPTIIDPPESESDWLMGCEYISEPYAHRMYHTIRFRVRLRGRTSALHYHLKWRDGGADGDDLYMAVCDTDFTEGVVRLEDVEDAALTVKTYRNSNREAEDDIDIALGSGEYYIWLLAAASTHKPFKGALVYSFTADVSTGGRLYADGAWKDAEPYIFDGTAWRRAETYISDAAAWQPTA